jgi:hypothetical protein
MTQKRIPQIFHHFHLIRLTIIWIEDSKRNQNESRTNSMQLSYFNWKGKKDSNVEFRKVEKTYFTSKFNNASKIEIF